MAVTVRNGKDFAGQSLLQWSSQGGGLIEGAVVRVAFVFRVKIAYLSGHYTGVVIQVCDKAVAIAEQGVIK